jgi:branched chain amino acid efflux pump
VTTAQILHSAALTGSDSSIRSGIRDMVPMMLAALPFGITVGATIAESAVDNLAGWLGAPLIAAGSAHLAAVSLIDAGGSAVAVVVTAMIINARLLGYSAALAPSFRDQPRWFRLLGSYFLIDQNFALASSLTDRTPTYFRRYYLAAMSTLLFPWIGAVSTGIALGPVVPESWDLWLAAPLMFAGMTATSLKGRSTFVASSVAALGALALSALPSGLGLLIAILVGAFAGAIAGGRNDA